MVHPSDLYQTEIKPHTTMLTNTVQFPSLSAWTHKTHGPEQDPYNLIHFVLREQHNISRTYDDHSYSMPDAMHERCILIPGTPSKWADEHGFNVPFTKTGTLTARRDDNKPVKGGRRRSYGGRRVYNSIPRDKPQAAQNGLLT